MIFLPPDGAPVIPDDDGAGSLPAEVRRSRSETENEAARQRRRSSVDELLSGSAIEYDTWASRKAAVSLTSMRGLSEATLGADELNAAVAPDGHLRRLRHVLAPDEAFGAIFVWEAVFANVRDLELAAWMKVAEEEGLALPDMDDVVRAEGMAAEAAVTRCFMWTADWAEIKRLVFRKAEVYDEMQKDWVFEVRDGVGEWLGKLKRYGIKSVLCAPRGMGRVLEIVEGVGLGEYFKTAADLVTIEDEYESLEQMYLTASIKLDRPPGKCVVFTDRPEGITAGREVSARVIALIGPYAAYEVKGADTAVKNFESLVVYSVRSLFAQEGLGFMDPETELEVVEEVER